MGIILPPSRSDSKQKVHDDAAKGEGTEMSQGRVGNNISDVIEDFNSNQQTSLIAQLVKTLLVMQETLVRFLSREDLLEKGTATHSSILGLPLRLSW